MNKAVVATVSFLAGTGAGWFLHKVLKDKTYEEQIEEEVQSVRDAYHKAQEADQKKTDENVSKDDVAAPVKENRSYGSSPKGEEIEKEQKEYREVLNRTTYRPETEKTEENLHRMASALKRPHVIDPSEIGTNEEYSEDPVELFYYADGTLCNDEGKPMSDIEIDQAVGSDFASHFGEYEEDSVVVENPQLKLYFVILKDLRTFEQVKIERRGS